MHSTNFGGEELSPDAQNNAFIVWCWLWYQSSGKTYLELLKNYLTVVFFSKAKKEEILFIGNRTCLLYFCRILINFNVKETFLRHRTILGDRRCIIAVTWQWVSIYYWKVAPTRIYRWRWFFFTYLCEQGAQQIYTLQNARKWLTYREIGDIWEQWANNRTKERYSKLL